MVKVFGISGDLLKQTVEKLEHLEQEKQEIQDHIKDTFAEAKGHGFE